MTGSENAVELVALQAGRYSVEWSVTDNIEFGAGTNFITTLYDENGTLCGFGTNEIGITANGAEIISIGSGGFNCQPGEIAVEISAAGD